MVDKVQIEWSDELKIEVQNTYETNQNYLIQINKPLLPKRKKLCAIYFSSNGIFYPKNLETYNYLIKDIDRYEWYKTRIERAEKHIFLRDINMLWYQKGINKDINSVDKILDFLKKETEGYDVMCIGSSAGAYAAGLFSCLLKGKYAICYSPSFNVKDFLIDNQKLIENSEYNAKKYLEYIENSENYKYNDILDIIKNSDTKIFYIYPNQSEVDKRQYLAAKQIENIKICSINSDIHGDPFSLEVTKVLINLIDKKFSGSKLKKSHCKSDDIFCAEYIYIYNNQAEVFEKFGIAEKLKYILYKLSKIKPETKRWYFLFRIKFYKKLVQIIKETKEVKKQ